MATNAAAPPPAASPLVDAAALLRGLPSPAAKPLSYAVTALLLLVALYSLGAGPPDPKANTQFPMLTYAPRRFDVGGFRRLLDFAHHAHEMFQRGHRQFRDAPFRVFMGTGDQTVLPPRYANELKSDPRASLDLVLRRIHYCYYRGFDVATKGGMFNHLVADVVRQDLTRELGKVTGPLKEETSYVISLVFGESSEWKRFELKDTATEVVARLSSRVFLGAELCRTREWLDITIRVTIANVGGAAILDMFPRFVRPLLNEILPICREQRRHQKRAGELIRPILAERAARLASLRAAGASAEELKDATANDSLEWFARHAAKTGRPYAPEMSQIVLSIAAIHTSSDLLTQLLLDLAEHPALLPVLRAELADVLGSGGWKRTTLYNLRKLDSCIRETQRLKPVGIALMKRGLTDDITLSDGTFLRKGSEIMVSNNAHWDPAIYTNPEEWDGLRFYHLRQQPGNEASYQAAVTSPEHMPYGHGQHACPGRFFAISEIKVAAAYFILKYDFRIVGGKAPAKQRWGLGLFPGDPALIEVRRREPEIDLEALPVP